MSEDSLSETKRIYHQAFVINSTAFFLSLVLIAGSALADYTLVAPYVHLADNVGLTASTLIGHSLVRLGWISSAISLVGVLLCYPLRYPRGPKDGVQLRRCAVAHSAGTIGVLFVLALTMILLCEILYRVTSSQHLLDLAMHTYADLFPVRHAFDSMQSNFRCCGGAGVEDWLRIHWTNRTEITRGMVIGVPSSCCTITTQQGCVSAVPAGTAWSLRLLTVHKGGCEELLKSRFRVVLLLGVLLLLTLIAMHGSTVVHTIRTAPAIDHKAHKSTQDEPHGISHEELHHIVVRSLADKRAHDESWTRQSTSPSMSASVPRRGTKLSLSTSMRVSKDASGTIGSEDHHGHLLLKPDPRRHKDRSKKRSVPALPTLKSALNHDRPAGHTSPSRRSYKPLPSSRSDAVSPAIIKQTTVQTQPLVPASTAARIPITDVIPHGDSRRRGTELFQRRPPNDKQPGVQHPKISAHIQSIPKASLMSPPVLPVFDNHRAISTAATAGSASQGDGGAGHPEGPDVVIHGSPSGDRRHYGFFQVPSKADGSGSNTASLTSPSSSLPLGATASTLLPLTMQVTRTDSTMEKTEGHGHGVVHKEDTGDVKDGGGQQVTSPGPAQGRVEFASDVDVAGSSVDGLPSMSLKQAAAANSAMLATKLR